MAAPEMDTPAYTPIARFRSFPSGKVTAISASEVGAANAPPMPCTTRAMSSQAWSVAKPPASEPSANSSDAEHEDPPPPEQVAGAPAEQQQPAEGERVGVDDPFQVGTGKVQRVLDVRQRHVDDGGIEHDHELRGRDDREREAEPPWRRRRRARRVDGGDGWCRTLRLS